MVRVKVRLGLDFSVWLVSGYAHVFVQLFVVTVILLEQQRAYTT